MTKANIILSVWSLKQVAFSNWEMEESLIKWLFTEMKADLGKPIKDNVVLNGLPRFVRSKAYSVLKIFYKKKTAKSLSQQ